MKKLMVSGGNPIIGLSYCEQKKFVHLISRQRNYLVGTPRAEKNKLY